MRIAISAFIAFMFALPPPAEAAEPQKPNYEAKRYADCLVKSFGGGIYRFECTDDQFASALAAFRTDSSWKSFTTSIMTVTAEACCRGETRSFVVTTRNF